MKTWLFRPFSRIAGSLSLGIGIAVLLATATIGWWRRGVYTDGVIDLHIGAAAPFPVFLMLGAMAWLILATGLLVVGHWLTTTRYRIVDLLGTQALARWPLLPASLVIGMPSYRKALEESTAAVMLSGGSAFPDIAIVLVLSLVPLAAVVWMVWLMYHSYALDFNLKGPRSVWSFSLVLIGAEILSKLAIYVLMSD